MTPSYIHGQLTYLLSLPLDKRIALFVGPKYSGGQRQELLRAAADLAIDAAAFWKELKDVAAVQDAQDASPGVSSTDGAHAPPD